MVFCTSPIRSIGVALLQVPELVAKFNGPLQRLQLRSLSQLAKEAWSFCFVVSGWVGLALTRLNSNIYIFVSQLHILHVYINV